MTTRIGTVIDGKYEILKQIGKGGMSIVYLAMDKRLNKQWAVKEIKRKGLDKNNEEVINQVPPDAEMMKRLDHPAIPRIVDIIDHKNSDYIYIVMDYVEGESLDKVLLAYGPQPQELVIDWAKQIADALGYLHSQKPPIIYRDMKPANVMLKPEGNIKIIDFGIAREYKEDSLKDTTLLGTKGYTSPEHFGGRQTDERSDIYTLGMTMHHLLTDVDPRPKDYQYASIRQWNPSLSGGLERIIDKCVSPDPKDRYQTCDELLYALDHYEEEEESYKHNQKVKLISFIVPAVLAIIFFVSGIVTQGMAKSAESNNYDNLIEINNLDYATANENITKAVGIDKKDPRAYQSFLEYSIGDMNITKDESQGLSQLMNTLKSSYDGLIDEQYAKLSYTAGINHFFYYLVEDTSSSMRDRAMKSIKYFEDIKDGGFEDSEMAKHFYTICSFYKTDLGNSVESRDYVTEYQQIFNSIDACIEYLDSYSESNANYVKAAMYKSTIDFINVNKKDIAQYSNISEETLLSLLDTISSKANGINEIENEKSRAYKTKKEVLEKIPGYKMQISEIYRNLNRQEG